MKKEIKDCLIFMKNCCIINTNAWWVVVTIILIVSSMIQAGIINTLNIPLYTPVWKYQEYALLYVIWEGIAIIPICIWGFISIKNALKYDF